MADIDRDVKIKIKGDVGDVNKKFDSVGDKAKQMGDKVSQAGNKGKQGLDKMGTSAESAKTDLAAVAVAVQGMTASIAGMTQQVLDFQSKIIALEKTIIGVQSQEVALRRMQEDLNTAVQEGTISLRDYERAIEDIELAFKNMRLEELNVEAETNKLNGEFVSFGINAVGTVAQITIAMTALGISSKTAFAGMIVGIRGVTTALWTVAKHPVFLIITAGILAWELALKGIVEDLTGMEDLGIFSNLQKFFEESIPMGTDNLSDLNDEWNAQERTLRQLHPTTEQIAKNYDNIGNSADSAADSVNRLTKGMEINMRAGGFRTGPGQPLSKVLEREAQSIERSTARTLAAASLRNALEEAGITGSVFGRNISGSITPTLASMQAAGRTRNSFTNSNRVFGTSTGRVTVGNNRFAGRSLTRSSARRRSGRDRNAFGRNDKFFVRRRNAIKKLTGNLNNEFGFDAVNFAGIDFGGVGTNNVMNRGRRGSQADIENAFAKQMAQVSETVKTRVGLFDSLTSGTDNRAEAFALFNTFGVSNQQFFDDPAAQWTNSLKTVINARNFFRGKSVNFEGSIGTGPALLGIRELGYRELNEQLAFQGEAQFETIGT